MSERKRLSILIYSNQTLPFIKLQKSYLEKLNHNVDLYIFEGKRNILKYMNEIKKIRSINHIKYDIIHAYDGSSGFIANFQRGIPVITTFIGSDLLGNYSSNGRFDYGFSIISFFASYAAQLFSKKLITISQNLSRRIYFNKKHKMIKLGVDHNHFNPIGMSAAREKLNWNNDAIYILFPANKNRVIKRYGIAKEIIEEISKEISSVKLISLEKPNMYPELPLIMSGCNAMIFVSFHEGSPNVIKEALACNLPIFSFDIGDVSEQLEGVTNSHVVNNGNKTALYKKLLDYLYKTPKKRSNGRNKIIPLSWDNYTVNVENIYYKALV